MIGSIQHGSAIATTETPIPVLMLDSVTNSTLISGGTSSVNDDTNVARELACQFCPLAT